MGGDIYYQLLSENKQYRLTIESEQIFISVLKIRICAELGKHPTIPPPPPPNYLRLQAIKKNYVSTAIPRPSENTKTTRRYALTQVCSLSANRARLVRWDTQETVNSSAATNAVDRILSVRNAVESESAAGAKKRRNTTESVYSAISPCNNQRRLSRCALTTYASLRRRSTSRTSTSTSHISRMRGSSSSAAVIRRTLTSHYRTPSGQPLRRMRFEGYPLTPPLTLTFTFPPPAHALRSIQEEPEHHSHFRSQQDKQFPRRREDASLQ